MASQKMKGYAFAIISAVSYGLIPLFMLPIKQQKFPVDTSLFYRFLIAAIFILGILFYKKESLKVSPKELGVLMVLGLLYGLSSDFLFWGYDLLTPGIASTILFVYPVLVALIMTLFFKEKIKKLTVFSLFFTLTGVYLLSMKGSGFSIQTLGLIVTLGGALFYALYIITVNRANFTSSAWKITFYSMVFTSAYYLIKALIAQETLLIPSPSFLGNFILFALVTTVVSMTTLVYAIQLIGSTPTSILGALEPVVAVLISVTLFHEILTTHLIYGVILILVGVIISILADNQRKRKRKRASGV